MKKIKSELILEVSKKFKTSKGFSKTTKHFSHGIKQTTIKLTDINMAKKIGREVGTYVSLDFDEILYYDVAAKNLLCQKLELSIKNLLKEMRIKAKKILVVGLGNEKYACDSFGKLTTDRILITKPYLDRNLYDKSKLSEVYAVSLGVYGTTGFESSELIKSLCALVRPDVVIAIDSMLAESTHTLASSIQISNTKLLPGGGVGNNRKEISEAVLGTKVIALGIPMVVNLSSLCNVKDNLIVTPKDVEQKVLDLSKITAKAINLTFNKFTEKELTELTA